MGVPIESAKQLEFKMKFMGLVVVALGALVHHLPSDVCTCTCTCSQADHTSSRDCTWCRGCRLGCCRRLHPRRPCLASLQLGSCWSPILYPDLRRHPCQDRLGQGGRPGRAWSCWVGGNQKSRKFSSDTKLLSIVIKL